LGGDDVDRLGGRAVTERITAQIRREGFNDKLAKILRNFQNYQRQLSRLQTKFSATACNWHNAQIIKHTATRNFHEIYTLAKLPEILHHYITAGGSVAERLACCTLAQKGPGSNRSRDAVG